MASDTGVRGEGLRAGVFGVAVGPPNPGGIQGVEISGDGVIGDAGGGSGTGVVGRAGTGRGVFGLSTAGRGVEGGSREDDGVVGMTNAFGKSGVFGLNTLPENATPRPGHGGEFPEPAGPSDAYGVTGFCDHPSGAGVNGGSRFGSGVIGHSENGYGGTFVMGPSTRGAQVRLVPSLNTGSPTDGNHQAGELYVDSHANLFFCKVEGVPGVWVQIA
jgi:hypothetical protein